MRTHQQTYRQYIAQKDGYYAGLLFLIWPLMSLASALRNYNEPWAKNIFWAYCAFYGFVFAIGAESQGYDMIQYIAEFQELHGRQMSVSDVIAQFQNSGEIDIYRTSLNYLLSRFTGEGAVLTLVYGAVFGFFLSRNIWFLLNRVEGALAPVTILLLTCFFFVNPIWEINAVRMWTAAHIFVYGMLMFLYDGKKGGLFIAALSILVHFSFVVPVGVCIGYLLFGNRVVLYFGFYVTTLFLSDLDLAVFNNFMEAYAPEILQDRTELYRRESAIEAREAQSRDVNWYVGWHARALKYSILGFLTILFLLGRAYMKEHVSMENLFSFTLLFYGVANMLSFLPSGGRYSVIANLLALALIVLYVQNREQEKLIKRFVWVSLPMLLLFVIVALRIGLYSISATAIMGNPIMALFITGEHISMNDVMRMIL